MVKNKKIRFKNIWIIRSLAVDPDPRVMRQAMWLRSGGYCVEVRGWDREKASKPIELVNGVKIVRFYAPGRFGKGIYNLFGLTVFNLRVFLALLAGKPHIVHACDLDTAIPSLVYSKLTGAKFVYDIFDFYVDSRNTGFLRPMLKALERYVIKKSDTTILPHEGRLNQIGELNDCIKKKITVIYNSPDVPRKINIKERVGRGPDAKLVFVGSLYPDRGILTLIKAVSLLGDDIELVVAGFGPLATKLRELSKVTKNFRFLGKVQYEVALALQAESLTIVAMYDPVVPNNRFAAPNKLFEACMLGKSIITNSGTLLADIVQKHEIGMVVPYGDEQSLTESIKYLINHPEKRIAMEQKAAELYFEGYSAEAMQSRLLKIYEQLLNEQHKPIKYPC